MPVADSLDHAGPGVAASCRRWKVHELADVLVTFEPDANWIRRQAILGSTEIVHVAR